MTLEIENVFFSLFRGLNNWWVFLDFSLDRGGNHGPLLGPRDSHGPPSDGGGGNSHEPRLRLMSSQEPRLRLMGSQGPLLGLEGS